jgi:hypothetical protein
MRFKRTRLVSLSIAQVFYSYLLGAIFFGDRMTLMGLFGVALILVGVLMVTMRSPKGITNRQAAQHAPAAALVLGKHAEAAAANVQPVAVLCASRAASLTAAAAGVEYGSGRRQSASLTLTLSRRASAKAAAKGREGLGEATEQPLLHVRDLSALQQGTMTASGVADAAVIITATGALVVSMSEGETAAAAAAAAAVAVGGGSTQEVAGGTAEPGMLSAFVQAALRSAARENDPGSVVDGECPTNNAALVVWQSLWAEIVVLARCCRHPQQQSHLAISGLC